MDRTHFLAAQSPARKPETGPATRAEIDAFYEAHGHEMFAVAYRLRRWLSARATRLGKRADVTRGFAMSASNR